MMRYSIQHPFWMSFYSGDIYEDVGKNWGRTTFLYLLVLLAVTWIPIVIYFNEIIGVWVDHTASRIVEQFPEITIEDGVVSVDAKEPVFIRDPDTNQTIIIIDVTGRYTSLSDTDASLLVTKTEVFIKQNSSDIRTYPIPPGEEPVVINQNTLYELLDFTKNALSIMLYPILVACSYAYRLVQVLFYGWIGLLIVQRFNAKMEYPALVRIAIVAITPAVILDTLHTMMEVSLPFWWAICFLLSISYLYFGIKMNVITENHEESS